MNLELMADFGPEAWKAYNETLQRMLTRAQKELALLRQRLQEINAQRKRKQVAAGETLKKLETGYAWARGF